MRADVLAAAQRPPAGARPIPWSTLYLSLAERLERAIDELPDDALDAVTPNGLTAHDLVVHMAAQESLLAQNLGVPDDRRPRRGGDRRPHATRCCRGFADRDLGRRGRRCGATRSRPTGRGPSPTPTAPRSGGVSVSPATTRSLVRSFEAWIHSDDLRRVSGFPTPPPEPRHLSLMSDLAGRILPLALAVAGREHDGKTARLVLTGDGGGDWMVPMGAGDVVAVARRDRHRRRRSTGAGSWATASTRPSCATSSTAIRALGRDLVALGARPSRTL